MRPDELAEGVLAGDRRAVARAISLVEDGSPDLPALGALLYPRTGRARTLGLTGSPGVGKSSLAARLVETARARDLTVAVLAIDPTSPFTGGALLGDRIRMQAHATDPGVFIRSMATRGHLGGMALAAPEAVRILDASGKDLIIVETVGVGQAEVEVAGATDTTLVVVAPGWGDAVQVAKAGILEIADVFVVNKGDLDGGDDARRDLRQMLNMGAKRSWAPPVVKASALTGEGMAELWEVLDSHAAHLESTGVLGALRRRRVLDEIGKMVAFRLQRRVEGMLREEEAGADGLADAVAGRRLDPYRAAAILLDRIASTRAPPPGGRDG